MKFNFTFGKKKASITTIVVLSLIVASLSSCLKIEEKTIWDIVYEYLQTYQPDSPLIPELQKNDVLLLYTDGITEARNRQGEEFGYDRLRLALDSVAPVRDAGEIRQGIMKHLYLFTGGIDVNDDHTMLVIRSGNNPSTDKPVSNISLKTINP